MQRTQFCQLSVLIFDDKIESLPAAMKVAPATSGDRRISVDGNYFESRIKRKKHLELVITSCVYMDHSAYNRL